MGAPQALCFAASNTDASVKGKESGPSGVYCSSTDYNALYDYQCDDDSEAAPCSYHLSCNDADNSQCAGDSLHNDKVKWAKQLKKKCRIKLKSSLSKAFPNALSPSDGKDGTAIAGCGYKWIVQGDIRQRDKVEYFPRQAACGLLKPASNRYDSQLCYGPGVVGLQKTLDEAGLGYGWTCSGDSKNWFYNFGSYSSPEHNFCNGLIGDDDLFSSNYDCFQPGFVYPWFPRMAFKDTYDIPPPNDKNLQDSPFFLKPSDSMTRRMFRLPVLDISRLSCTPR